MDKQKALNLVKEHLTYLKNIQPVKQLVNSYVEKEFEVPEGVLDNSNDGSDLIMVLEEIVIPILERDAKIESWAKEVYGKVQIKRV